MMPSTDNLQAQLEERLRFETLLADLSTRFVGLPAENLDREIESAQRRICEHLGVDRSTLFQFNGPNGEAHFTHSWAADGFEANPRINVELLFPWVLSELRQGRSIRADNADYLPAEAVIDRESVLKFGPKSNVTLPLFAGGEVLGALAFGALRVERTWPEELVNRLQLIAEIFASSLARRRSDLRLRESEARLQLATDSANAGLWSFDLEGQRVWLNPRMRDLFQFAPAAEPTFENFIQAVHPDDRADVQHAVQRARETDAPLLVEHRLVLPDGSLRWISHRGHRNCDAAGRPVRVMGVSVDITERRLAEIETRRYQQELTHVSRVSTMGELAGSLAHELNQPLTAILSNVQAAQRYLNNSPVDLAEVREILQDVVAENHRASEIITRIRTMMKKEEVQMAPCDITRHIREVLRLLNSDLVVRNVSATLQLAPHLPLVNGDRVQLEQVLLNLIMNGCDAMSACAPGQRQLVIEAKPDDDGRVRVSVADRGTGIAPGLMERVFEPFYTTKASGLGLGLPICRSIITAHSGRLWAAGNPDGGATFYFTLAIAGQTQA